MYKAPALPCPSFPPCADPTQVGRDPLLPALDFAGGVAGVGQGVVDAYERGSGGLVLRAKVGKGLLFNVVPFNQLHVSPSMGVGGVDTHEPCLHTCVA
jgi:hypothetical protein